MAKLHELKSLILSTWKFNQYLGIRHWPRSLGVNNEPKKKIRCGPYLHGYDGSGRERQSYSHTYKCKRQLWKTYDITTSSGRSGYFLKKQNFS